MGVRYGPQESCNLRTVTRRAALLVLAAFLVLVPMAPVGAKQSVPAHVWDAYADAISDSSVSQPSEVATDLVVADPSDRRTQWTTIDGEQYMLVFRLGFRPASDASPGEAFQVSSYLFVTVPEEVREECKRSRCARMNASQLDRRLKQLIGLPPDADYRIVTQMWVRPADLFRPCTQVDPMVPTCPQLMTNAIHAGVDRSPFLLDQAMYSWRLPNRRTTEKVSCAKDFQNQTRGNCFGFPWTRLGYTFDWRPSTDERGVTEFVVAPGSTVIMESSGKQREYFPFRRSVGAASGI